MSSQGTILLEDDRVIKLCDSDLMYTRKYKWRIDNYSSLKKGMGDEIESPTFTVGPNKETTWCCKITPGRGNGNCKLILSFCLQDCTYPDTTAYAKIKLINISNGQGTILWEGCVCGLRKLSTNAAYGQNISMEGDLKEKSAFLSQQFHISWEITVFVDKFANDISTLIKDNEMKLSNDIKKLFYNSKFADVELVASDGQVIHAHKAILAARSPVFRAMFTGDMKEKRENRVQIIDMESSVLEDMLGYMYGLDIDELHSDTPLELLEAADKYDLKDLKSLCENQLLVSGPSMGDAAEYLRIAFMHNASEKVKMSIVKYVKENLNEIKRTEEWKDLTRRYPYLLREILEYSLSLW